jgi:Meiotically up-regulated gene 113
MKPRIKLQALAAQTALSLPRSRRLRNAESLPEHGGVYAVAGAPGWVKIGRAKNIAQRVRGLQTASPTPLRLLAVLSNSEDDERLLHERWQHLRVTGEWFRTDAELDRLLSADETERAAFIAELRAADGAQPAPIEQGAPSPAAKARAIYEAEPWLSPSDIAARIGSSRQAVESALAVTHPRPGRPGAGASRMIRLSAAPLDAAAGAADHQGMSLRVWIEAAIAEKLRR